MIIVSEQITTFLVAMLPIAELRGAIPLAMGIYKMSATSAFFWSVLGNVISVDLVLWLLEPVSKFLSHKNYFWNRFFSWLFAKTRKKHSHKFEIWGALALIAFVAIPLPFTGGWSGAVAAFVFGIEFKKALPLITLGILIAGIIVTLASLGVLAANI